MKRYARVAAPLLLLGCAAPAFAQMYSYPFRPVQWYVDGGASITAGQTANYFNNGWSIGTGVNFLPYPDQPFWLRAEVNYNRSEATGEFIALNQAATNTPIDDGNMQTVTGFLDGVWEAPISPWARFYATAGLGIGWRRLELTQNGFFCNSFFCGPGFGSDNLVASNDSTHFAWNAGVGMNFPLPTGQSWFIEARYERIETESPTEYIPLRVGFRF